MGKDVIINKIDQNDDELVLSVEKGGTGGNNQTSAEQNLEFILSSKLNAPLGVAGLDNTRHVKKEQLPISIRNLGISIDGAKQVTAGSINNYSIVGYSGFDSYTVSVSAGSISRTNGNISFTAPNTPQTVSLTINGRVFTIDVVPASAYVNTPSITSPINGAVNQGPDVVINSSAFSVSGGTDTHEGTDWQVATDATFTNIVTNLVNNTSNKISLTITGLLANTQYFIRARYKGINLGYGNWSATVIINTKISYYPTTEQAILTAGDKASNDQFGGCVALDATGSRVAIGAPGATPNGYGSYRGKLYIFARSGNSWTQEALILSPDTVNETRFGDKISISGNGDRIIVGSRSATVSGQGSAGKAYIFVRSGTTWTIEATLSNPTPAGNDQFGTSVSMDTSGTRVAIGVPYKNIPGYNGAGEIVVFIRSGSSWTQEAIVRKTSSVSANDWLGVSVAISGDGTRIISGGKLDTYNVNAKGEVTVFVRSGTTWTQEQIIPGPSNINEYYFGMYLDIDETGSRFISSEYSSKNGSTYPQGKAYIFKRTGTSWAQEQAIISNDIADMDFFGCWVSISSNGLAVAIGAMGYGTIGKAYIFSYNGVNWVQNSRFTNNDNQDRFGYSVSISGDGTKLAVGAYKASPSSISEAGQVEIFV
jgi:hypothetical protein